MFIPKRAKTPSLICRVIAPLLLLAFLGGPPGLWAQTKVLIYNNSDNGLTTTAAANLTGILTALGAQVTTIAISTVGYCPTGDNWGSYNQVWDLRMAAGGIYSCPVAFTDDAFTACWQAQAATYLASGGGLYLEGEFDAFNSRDQGISDFLINNGAVSPSYTDCPGTSGNGEDGSTAIFPCTIPGQAGPYSFTGIAFGGIPVQYLNGSNFVSDPVVADWADAVNRSTVSGWRLSQGQMTTLTGTGNLVVVWDSNTLVSPVFSGTTQPVITNFIQGVYCYLNGGLCAGVTPTITATPNTTFTPTFTPTHTFTPSFTTTPVNTFTPSATFTFTTSYTPTNTCTVTTTSSPTPTFTPTATFTPTCVTYVWPNPFNPKTAVGNTLRVSCMTADSTVAIYTIAGELVRTLNQGAACQVPDMWGMVYCWDGRNQHGFPVATGVYLYVVEQNNQVTQRGKFLMINGN